MYFAVPVDEMKRDGQFRASVARASLIMKQAERELLSSV